MAGKNEYTVFDYLQWRGDLTLQQDPFNEVDNLVLCIIAYINLRKIDRLWSKNPKDAMLIGDVCARLTAADEQLGLSSLDYIPVMRAAAETERFRDTRLFAFESRNDEAKQMQFAAVSFLLPDGSVFIAYRGTDTSLVGWKENFNMSYLETVPAQARATEYAQEVIRACKHRPYRIGGHSKGGNLAAWAAVHLPEPGESPVLAAVQALPERYRQAVYLRYYEGYEPAEIGTLMGCTASQVSTYLYRGKAKLRNMLGGAYGQECLSE